METTGWMCDGTFWAASATVIRRIEAVFDTVDYEGTDNSETFLIRDGSITAGSRAFNFQRPGAAAVVWRTGETTRLTCNTRLLPRRCLRSDGGFNNDAFTLKTIAGTPHLIGKYRPMTRLTAAVGDYGFCF